MHTNLAHPPFLTAAGLATGTKRSGVFWYIGASRHTGRSIWKDLRFSRHLHAEPEIVRPSAPGSSWPIAPPSHVPAYLYEMVRESNSRPPGGRITKQLLASFGKKIKFYDGVVQIFSRLEKHARGVAATVSVEFYLVSGGIGEILRSTKIAKSLRIFGRASSTTTKVGRSISRRTCLALPIRPGISFTCQRA